MFLDKYILDSQDNPVVCNDLMQWTKWFETIDRVIRRTDFGVYVWLDWIGRKLHTKIFEPVIISTVFLGLDHNYSDNGPPLIFETMIVGGKHDEYQERYATKKQALAGHDKAIQLVKKSFWLIEKVAVK